MSELVNSDNLDTKISIFFKSVRLKDTCFNLMGLKMKKQFSVKLKIWTGWRILVCILRINMCQLVNPFSRSCVIGLATLFSRKVWKNKSENRILTDWNRKKFILFQSVYFCELVLESRLFSSRLIKKLIFSIFWA